MSFALRRLAQRRLYSSTPVAPPTGGSGVAAAGTPNEWVAKRNAVQAHAAQTAGMWKKIFFYVCAPGLVVAAVYTKRVEDEHHAHMEHLKHERGDEPLPEYSYMNKRQKPFPWGMNTLFFNPEVNKDMSQASA
ncbi:Cytochrome c oxidase subunit 6A, mitochondrial [Tulasnella sp. UAMH 9824]|nr:Cytochrome c oxidase subunit 6A, mitochondrial [Tulasnella sp. UAMH 9824]